MTFDISLDRDGTFYKGTILIGENRLDVHSSGEVFDLVDYQKSWLGTIEALFNYRHAVVFLTSLSRTPDEDVFELFGIVASREQSSVHLSYFVTRLSDLGERPDIRLINDHIGGFYDESLGPLEYSKWDLSHWQIELSEVLDFGERLKLRMAS